MILHRTNRFSWVITMKLKTGCLFLYEFHNQNWFDHRWKKRKKNGRHVAVVENLPILVAVIKFYKTNLPTELIFCIDSFQNVFYAKNWQLRFISSVHSTSFHHITPTNKSLSSNRKQRFWLTLYNAIAVSFLHSICFLNG